MSRKRLLQVMPILVICLLAIVWASAVPNKSPVLSDAYPNIEDLYQFSSIQSFNQRVHLDSVTPSDQGALVINEVMFYPNSSGYEWVELLNTSSEPVLINGYGITDEDDNWYIIPDALPAVPGGAFVLVIFDGLGSASDDYDFGDNVVTLHSSSGLVDIFEDDIDQVALYRTISTPSLYLPMIMENISVFNPPLPGLPGDNPESDLVGFVAWGSEPGTDADEAAVANIWNQSWFVSIYRGLGEETDETLTLENETLGLLPGGNASSPSDWTLYQVTEVSQGAENPWPQISWFYPDPGSTVDGATFSIIWNMIPGTSSYQFQMDDNNDFSSPLVDSLLSEPAYIAGSPVAEGLYYWRVKSIASGSESPWTTGVAINSLTLPPPSLNGTNSTDATMAIKTLGIGWQLQHKDTNMLCLAGDAETGNNAWNAPHTTRGTHGRNYCVRGSVAMIASYYGGELSQDRITYETFKTQDPEKHLGHDVPFTGVQARASLAWALGQAVPAQFGKPTFAEIKGWIDADRPMRAVIPGHSRAIDGYFEFTIGAINWQFLHILDPWDQAKWVNYADDNIIYVQVGPAGAGGAPNVKSDEDVDTDGIADTMDDSDGDGVSDFDERNRFGLIVSDPDTDGDYVNDLPDIREYVFNAAGAYNWRNPDSDNDGDRKEKDPDNDHMNNDGIPDGCEDVDLDGKFEPTLGELNNFLFKDDTAIHVRLSWPLLGSDVDLHLINPGGTYQSTGDCWFAERNPDWGVPGESCDDPNLDIDCISTCTVENIRLGKPENGTYSIKVHYYWDHDLGPTSPMVTIWVKGGVPMTFGPRQISDDEVWDVATVTWPTGTLTVVDEVSTGPVINFSEALKK